MSRIANSPIPIPGSVTISQDRDFLTVKGGKGQLGCHIHNLVEVNVEDAVITVIANGSSKQARALAGTTRSLLNNMVIGVADGFEKRLTLVGVGYRGQVKGKILDLTLGFSHPVEYDIPEGITVETPSQTEVVVKGIDKQKVGQVAAKIRSFRPPEPYKGKGVRYIDENVVRKEAKKK
jgi:large subunit ribosomal protein L6